MPKTHMITEVSYARLIFNSPPIHVIACWEHWTLFWSFVCDTQRRTLWLKGSFSESNKAHFKKATFCPCSLRQLHLYAFLKQNPILYKVVLTSEFLNEIPRCGYLNESYREVLPCGAVYYTVQGGWTVYETPKLYNWDKGCLRLIFCGTVNYAVHEFFNLWCYGWKRCDNSKGTSSAVLFCCTVSN